MKERIDFYRQMRDLEYQCRSEVYKLLAPLNNQYEFDSESDYELMLDCYDYNGSTYQTIIDKIEAVKLPDGNVKLNIYPRNGRTCNLSDFIDCSIIYIYDHLYSELHPDKDE